MRFAAEAMLVLLLSVGCASTAPRAEVTAKPISDELPDLRAIQGTIPLEVGVERAADRPRIMLVAPLPEPELTPEERAILGEDEDRGYDPLELYRPPIAWGQGIDPLSRGVLSGVGGWGGAAVGVGPFLPPWGVGSGMGGAALGISTHGKTLAGAGPAGARPQGIGPRSPVDVGNRGPKRRVGAAYPAGRD